MGFRNASTPAGSAVVVASATPVNYIALQVITSSNLTYLDGNGATTTLTAVPALSVINCQITQVSVCSGVVIGFTP